MKKTKFLLAGIIAFFLYSCSDELDIPLPSEPISKDVFGISEAKRYFEDNANDLSFMHFEDHAPSTRSAKQQHLELTPDWSKAVRTTNHQASVIEVPILSNAIMLSSVNQFEKGEKMRSKHCLSSVRLVIAQDKEGKTHMFIITLLPSLKYGNQQKEMEDFRYLGGSNFTGKVFASTLDGRFVEASQYVNGQFVGLLNVTTRKKLEENNIDIKNDNFYESINFLPAVKTRSGTYSFDESGDIGGGGSTGGGGGGGGGGSNCQFHPQYPASDCPYCLHEVVVRTCQTCGARLEEGETCNCRCLNCGYYPCRCCDYCHMYPCTCISTCDTCRPYPCQKCTKCGRHYCFGSCESIGGGGSTGGGTTNPPVIPDTEIEIIKPLYSETSTLNSRQKILLNTAVKDFIDRSEQFKKMYDRLVEKEVKMKFEIDPEKVAKSEGKASYLNKTISFYGEDYIHLNYCQEELIHAVQDLDIYGQAYMLSTRKNIEFEAKIIQDMVSQVVGGPTIGNMGQTDEFIAKYEEWLWQYVEQGYSIIVNRFHEFCNPWTGYSGSYKLDFIPKTIKKYFK